MSDVLRSASLTTALVCLSFPALAAPSEVLHSSARLPTMPLIGDTAHDFEAQTTRGKVKFPGDYRGKWVVLFSHPADFTPVCTSEFIAMNEIADDLRELSTELLALSVDGIERHRDWLGRIESNLGHKIGFPVIADPGGEVAWRYGMIHPSATDERTVRAVFIIDPEGVIRAMMYYPMESGRSSAEIKRMIISLQTVDRHRVVTPADWQPGDKVLLPVDPKSPRGKGDCRDWYYCERPLPKSSLTLPKRG